MNETTPQPTKSRKKPNTKTYIKRYTGGRSIHLWLNDDDDALLARIREISAGATGIEPSIPVILRTALRMLENETWNRIAGLQVR
jgi:hypothetical protein